MFLWSSGAIVSGVLTAFFVVGIIVSHRNDDDNVYRKCFFGFLASCAWVVLMLMLFGFVANRFPLQFSPHLSLWPCVFMLLFGILSSAGYIVMVSVCYAISDERQWQKKQATKKQDPKASKKRS